jgi:hypothetical protein
VLTVIDLQRAVRDPKGAVVAAVVAGCAPVRVAVSLAGATVWVTARDANALLGFSAPAVRTGPARAGVRHPRWPAAAWPRRGRGAGRCL